MTSRKQLQIAGWAPCALLSFAPSLNPQGSASESPLVKQIDNGNWLDPKEAASLIALIRVTPSCN